MKKWVYLFIIAIFSFCSYQNTAQAQRGETVEAEVSQSQHKIHIVEDGDDLHLLAAKYYNNARLWYIIYGANRDTIKNPNLIYPGQKVVIPMEQEGDAN